jgi:hypothetical protein
MKTQIENLFIVKIPHQMPATCDLVIGKQGVIDYAMSRDDFSYERYTQGSAEDIWGDDIPAGLAGILQKHEEAIEVSDCSGTWYYSAKEAPSEYDAAVESIGRDLNWCDVFTEEEARDFCTYYKGHQQFKVIAAVESELELV